MHRKAIRFCSLIGIIIILHGPDCFADTKGQAILTNDVPRCVSPKEADSEMFERLERVETEIIDTLRFLHFCDVVHHKMNLSMKSPYKSYIDTGAYLQMRQDLLKALIKEMEQKRIVAEMFPDRPAGKGIKNMSERNVPTNLTEEVSNTPH